MTTPMTTNCFWAEILCQESRPCWAGAPQAALALVPVLFARALVPLATTKRPIVLSLLPPNPIHSQTYIHTIKIWKGVGVGVC